MSDHRAEFEFVMLDPGLNCDSVSNLKLVGIKDHAYGS